MLTRRTLPGALAFALIVQGVAMRSAWAAPDEVSATPGPTASPAPVHATPSEPPPTVAREEAWARAFDKHAPLAFFSVGSLAVGGLILGIRADSKVTANQQGLGRRDIGFALGLAGASALAGVAAFWHYAHADVERDIEVTSGSPAPASHWVVLPTFDGSLGAAAVCTWPLAWLGG